MPASDLRTSLLSPDDQIFVSGLEGLDTMVGVMRERDMVLVGWNRAAELRTGWTKAERIGQRHDVMYPPQVRDQLTDEKLFTEIRPRLEAALDNPMFQRRVWTKDGEELAVWGPLFRWTGSDGESYLIIWSITDDAHGSLPEAMTAVVSRVHDERFEEMRGQIEKGPLHYARLTIRVNDPVARAVNRMADEQGVTVNAMLQALLEGFAGSAPVRETYAGEGGPVPVAAFGFVQDVIRTIAEGVLTRARELDRNRRRRK